MLACTGRGILRGDAARMCLPLEAGSVETHPGGGPSDGLQSKERHLQASVPVDGASLPPKSGNTHRLPGQLVYLRQLVPSVKTTRTVATSQLVPSVN